MKFKTSIKRRVCGKHKAGMELADFNNKIILDIGCSFGIFEEYTCNKAKKIIAIDINKKDLEIARREVRNKKVIFREGGVFELEKITREKFNVVVMFDVIEHIPKNTEIAALRIINKALKKSGILVVSTPVSNISKFFDPAWYFGHRHYSKNKLKEIFKKAGFKIQKTESRGGFFEIFSMFLFYPCKWLFNSEIPFKKWFDKKRDREYKKDKKEGFVTWFITAKKISS